MKKITEEDIKVVESELVAARKKFEEMNYDSLEDKLKWIRDFFNVYVPNLENRFMTEEEIKETLIFLPNELRIMFFLYFPEHGLNMANYSQELFKEVQKSKTLTYANRFYFRHDD